MTDDLDSLLATIDSLEDDDTDDPFPWTDAAWWSPAVVELPNDPYDTLPMVGDGCVIVCDPLRPWVIVEYQPPWWAR